MPGPSEAGPSRQSNRPAQNGGSASVKRGRKTGGTGKKGKKFMDDKSSILNLIEDVTSAKEASTRAKLSKLDRGSGGGQSGSSREPAQGDGEVDPTAAVQRPRGDNGGSNGHAKPTVRKKSKALLRKQEIDRAKVSLMEKAKEKKRLKKGPLPTSQQPAPRRKVAFST